MADYTFNVLVEPLKNDSTIQTVLDVDALAAPARAALAGYVASLQLPAAQTQHLTWENVGVAVLIQSLNLTYYLPSLGNQTPAPALKRTSTLQDRVIEMQSLESKFPKCQILIFGKNAGEANWIWLNTETIQNSGNRVNTLKLVPYLSQGDSFVPGRKTQIGIQFIADPVSRATLPQAGDRLTVQSSVHLDVNPIGADAKKNNDEVALLETRLAALETLIQPFGAATATASGTTGLVEGAAVGESEFLLRGDRQWQNPAAFVKVMDEQVVEGAKTFAQALTGNSLIRSGGSGDLSALSAKSQSVLHSKSGAAFIALVSASAPTNAKIAHIGLTAEGLIKVKRLNDNYSADVSTLMSFDLENNLELFNFTNFGNVFLKIFQVKGNLPSNQGGVLNIPLVINGATVDSAKVNGILPVVEFDANGRIPPNITLMPGYQYEAYVDNDAVSFRLHPTNSSGLTSKPCSCLVFCTN